MDNAPPTTHLITEFYKWYKEGRLILKPPYQRKPVWSLKNKSYLIDTLLNGLPVPEVYMQVKTNVKGNSIYEIVDGQQRLRAIFEYIDGEYAILDDEQTPEYRGKEFTDLSDGDKTNLWSYPVVTRQLRTNNDYEVRGIFQRLNKNVVPLNPQELRHSTYSGHFIEMVEKFADEEFWTENKIVTPNDVKRMLDAEFVSELIIAMMHGVQAKNTETLDGYYKMYDQTFTEKEDVRKRFNAIRNKIEEILGDLRPTRWRYKSEFYALFAALDELMKEYTIPPERYGEIGDALCAFSNEADNVYRSDEKGGVLKEPKGKPFTKSQVVEFVDSVQRQSANKEPRTKRVRIVRELLIPFLIARDPQRDFTEEERRIAWGLARDKKCAICGKVVKWDDYHLDHKLSHHNGGKTELRNSQITHKKCNTKKGKK